jgi:outer membrane protein assembly factor BamE
MRLIHRPNTPPSSAAAIMVCLALISLAGCTSNDPSRTGLFEPYRIDLPQGNYVTQAMLERVRIGMSTEQVREALGSPLLGHVFHAGSHALSPIPCRRAKTQPIPHCRV